MSNNTAPTNRELRTFGLLTGTIFAGLFAVFIPWILRRPTPRWPWLVAGLLVSTALAKPSLLGQVHRCWSAFGSLMGWLNSRLALTAVFYLVFVPVGALMRSLGKDPMARRFGPELSTYRLPSRQRAIQHMEKPF